MSGRGRCVVSGVTSVAAVMLRLEGAFFVSKWTSHFKLVPRHSFFEHFDEVIVIFALY